MGGFAGLGGQVDAPNKNTATALQMCCMRPGMEDIVAMLLAAGSDPDVTSQDGHCAVTVAVSGRSISIT